MKQFPSTFGATAIAGLLIALLVGPGTSLGGDPAGTPDSTAPRAGVGVGLDLTRRTIVVEVELAAPSVCAAVHRGLAAARVMSRAALCVGKHCLRELSRMRGGAR
jgi:hypothetical protein